MKQDRAAVHAAQQKRTLRQVRLSDLPGENVFAPIHEFTDEVHGEVLLNTVERDAVDTPEFQRLFRLSHLGLVDLVYQTANHTRGAHSIGTCHTASILIDRLHRNIRTLERLSGRTITITDLAPAEEVLIRLGALLHDIPHGPFSHDIEKKTHHIYLQKGASEERVRVQSHYGPYVKHDDWQHNPALYIALLDKQQSVLARLLDRYSPKYWELLITYPAPHLEQFIAAARDERWPTREHDILPQLLFHLLVFEKTADAKHSPTVNLIKEFKQEKPTLWALGPHEEPPPDLTAKLHEAWYQPYRHDIIGDTLSADLLDYSARDARSLGMKGGPENDLLQFYVLAKTEEWHERPLYRCAIELYDYKRGTIRTERINDIFRLLDLRHEVHEKAVFHRVTQSGIAMLARAIQLLQDPPAPKDLYGFNTEKVAISGDDHFLNLLQQRSDHPGDKRNLATRLIERRIFRPLMIIPGDRVNILLTGERQGPTELNLRSLAAIVDSTAFSPFVHFISWMIEQLLEHSIATKGEHDERHQFEAFIRSIVESKKPPLLQWARQRRARRVIVWTQPFKQLYKDPSLVVAAELEATTIDELARKIETKVTGHLREVWDRVQAGVTDAERKYENLWKLYVFISDGLYYTGCFTKLLKDHPCQRDKQRHAEHLREAQRAVVVMLWCMWMVWQQRRDDLTSQQLEEWLAREINDAEFLDLLQSFVARLSDAAAARRAKEASTVKLEHYLHEQDGTQCRDARYKLSAYERVKPEHWLYPVLQRQGNTGAEFSEEELTELSNKFTDHGQLYAAIEHAMTAPQRKGALDRVLRQVYLGYPG